MSDRSGELVDEFLDDLGSAPVPSGLAAGVRARIRDERPSRTGRPSAWLALAVAAAVVLLAGVAWAVAGPRPSPTGPPDASPAPTSTAPSAPPTNTPSPVPPTPSPTESEAAQTSWTITLDPGVPHVRLALTVLDRAGTMTGVQQAAGDLPLPGREDPHALDIGPGRDARSLTVGWTGSACDERAELALEPDGRTLTLRFPPRAGCDAVGIGYRLELRFADRVDPAGFHGTWSTDLVAATDVRPTEVAFEDPQHGWVGGTTPDGDAIILETQDGGTTWRVAGLGSGDVTDIAAAGDGQAWAGRGCEEAALTCHVGIYRLDDSGLWGWSGLGMPVGLSFAGPRGAAVLVPPGSLLTADHVVAPELRLTDGGDVWKIAASPCPEAFTLQAVTQTDGETLAVVCESQGAGGTSHKELHRSMDRGETWAQPVSGPDSGTGTGIDLRPDGTGWLWADRSPLLTTSDGGTTWTALDVADGDVRIVYDADAWGGDAGIALVWDPDRQATLLLRTDDGRAWTELFAWPAG